MDPLDYLPHTTIDNNKVYSDFCFISSHPATSYVHFDSPLTDSFTDDPKHPPTPFPTTSGPYPSPPLTGSALGHTVSLPQLSDGKASSQDSSLCPSDMQQQPPLSHVPISPPSTLPIATLALPLDSDDNVLSLPSPTSSSGASPVMDHDLLPPEQYEGSEDFALQLPTPWTPANWLMVGPSPLSMSSEQDDILWEEDRRTPQPLCAEPTHSVWSPDSPPRKDELEMDSEPSSPSSSSSSWSSELLTDSDSAWHNNWANQLPSDWARSRGSDHEDDYSMHSNCLDPIYSPFDDSSCSHYNPYGPEQLRDLLYTPMDTVDDDGSSSLSEDEQELLRSPVSSLRRCASLPGWDDDDPEDRLLLPQTPSRRTLLRDLGADDDEPPQSPGILTLPGAENDELPDLNLISPLPGSEIDLISSDNMFYGLGLSLSPSISIGSPSPEHTNSKDLLSDFPELFGYPYEIPNDLAVPMSHPAYDVVKLLRLCRKSKQAERDARHQETQLGEQVASISANLLPPLKMDAIPRKNMLRELHAAVEMRTEARKIRKKEKEKWKEVRSWLRLKLEELAKERAGNGHIIEDTQKCVEGVAEGAREVENLGKKWMMNDMGQLVAKMMFRRRDMARPLAKRKMANVAKEYVSSPLATPVHTATENSGEMVEDDDVDEILDEMQGIIPSRPLPLEDVEMPLIIN